jgi:ubiquinone/menaquinone biosynthesis C-methylase UbiE
MSEFSVQVKEGHYVKSSYLTKDRWINYWYQWRILQQPDIKSILEIGVGNGVVAELFQKTGMQVTTIDIDANLRPTQVASVTALPFAENQFDAVLCAEVLEHLPFEQSQQGMHEIYRVTKKWALVTLPHAGYVFSVTTKFPLLSWWSWVRKLPFFWKEHAFQGEHYWELGKKGWSQARLRDALISVGFKVHSVKMHADDPAHVFFWCEKISA